MVYVNFAGGARLSVSRDGRESSQLRTQRKATLLFLEFVSFPIPGHRGKSLNPFALLSHRLPLLRHLQFFAASSAATQPLLRQLQTPVLLSARITRPAGVPRYAVGAVAGRPPLEPPTGSIEKARNLFDVMPLGRGSIDSLPDGVLQHMLGFLEAREAVRTCVLARRWRYLWMSATGLRIVYTNDDEVEVDYLTAMRKYRQFVDCFLDCRGQAPLETCEISFEGLCDDDDDFCINRWIRKILTLQVQMFRLSNVYRDDFELDDLPLVSRHLTRLELDGMELINSFFDFSSCPSLEHLEIASCFLSEANMISSESLKRLSITNCLFGKRFHTRVNVPNLVSLRLDSHLYRAPVIERMPALQDAYVRVEHENSNSRDCGDEDCYSCFGVLHGDNNKCVLLECLSEAENMSLISESKTFIFRRDLNKCPTFSKLKTLLLNESWCVAPDFPALTCILKNTPVLGKLTLQLFSKGPKHKVETIGMFNSMERSAGLSEQLKAIQVKCEVVDEKVNKVLKFLCTFNIRFIFR